MINIQSVETEWFDEKSFRLPPYKVGRVTINDLDGRCYIKILEDGLEDPFRLYTSLTTAINASNRMPPQLLEWYYKHGLKEAKRLLSVAQHYGTLMHITFGEFLRVGSHALNEIDVFVDNYLESHNFYERECDNWKEDLKYDLLAFVQFCYDYQVQPLAVELVLVGNCGIGTAIDLVCKMVIEIEGYFGEVYKTDCKGGKKGDPKMSKAEKTITALINFKSGKHGFYRENGIQCIIEQMLFEENFPDVKIEGVFNWAPKEWRESPTYTLKDWSKEEKITEREIEAIISLAHVRFSEAAQSKKYIKLDGDVFLGNDTEDNIRFDTIQQHCINRFTSTPLNN